MYQFDFTKYSPLDWLMAGKYGFANPALAYYLVHKVALFPIDPTALADWNTILITFGTDLSEYLSQFVSPAANPDDVTNTRPLTNLDATNFNARDIFRRDIHGE